MRIITGTARGTQLKAPKGMTTRPTADRIKESLFSILGARVQQAEVLDLFSGTGALALEALSRGASSATMVDQATAEILRSNAEKTRLASRAEIVRTEAIRFLKQAAERGRRYDLIFCDPPYHQGLAEKVLEITSSAKLLKEDGLLIIEHGTDEILPERIGELYCSRNQAYGRTTQLSIYSLKGDAA